MVIFDTKSYNIQPVYSIRVQNVLGNFYQKC